MKKLIIVFLLLTSPLIGQEYKSNINLVAFEPTHKIRFDNIIEIDLDQYKITYLNDDLSLRQASTESFKLFWKYFGEQLYNKGKEIKMENEHKFMRIVEKAIGQIDNDNTLSECISEICVKENVDPVEVGEWIKNFKGLLQVIEHNAKKFKLLNHHENPFETISISEYF